MTEPVIEVKVAPNSPRARYVLRYLMTAVGFPFRLVDEWKSPALKVLCAPVPEGAYDLYIPYLETRRAAWRVRWVDNLPLIHDGSLPMPAGFIVSNRVAINLVGITFDLLSRAEEVDAQPLALSDSRFEGYRSILYDLGLLQRPVINLYISALRDWLGEELRRRGYAVEPVPLWKEKREFAVVLSHDVDRIRYFSVREGVARLLRTAAPALNSRQRLETLIAGLVNTARGAKGLLAATDPFWNFEIWTELEDRFGFRSTFYVVALGGFGTVNDVTYRLGDTIRFRGRWMRLSEILQLLQRDGWEIGLHGSILSYRNSSLLNQQKACLESAIGTELKGIRQHYLMFQTPLTWRLQAQAGFRYDSTLGYNKRLGFRAGVGLPFQPYDLQAETVIPLLELPLVIQDGVVMDEEPAGIDWATQRSIRIFEVAKEVGGFAVLLWHPNVAFEKVYPGWLQVYINLLEWLREHRAFVGTGSEISDWWIHRQQLVER